MAPTPRKYITYTNNERSIAGGQQSPFEAIEFEAPEDGTIVGVLVEVALSAEPLEPTLGYEHANTGGWVRLVVSKAGAAGTGGVFNQSSDWDAVGGVGTLSDADQGDTWAITPFALSQGGTDNGTSGYGGNTRVMLHPKTQRKMRRQDKLHVQLLYTNAGANEAVIQEVITATLFYLT